MLARAGRFELAEAAYDAAVKMYPKALIHMRHGARIVRRSDADKPPLK